MLNQIDYKDLVDIDKFMNSINSLIEGKYLLIEMKAAEVIEAIYKSEKIKNFIDECLADFDFDSELKRSYASNSFNDGGFRMPSSSMNIVAWTYSFLKGINNKDVNFQKFMIENFPSTDTRGDYTSFSKSVLIPFRNIIAEHFGVNPVDNTENFEKLEENIRDDKLSKHRLEEIKRIEKEEFFEKLDEMVEHMIDLIKNDKKIRKSKKDDQLYILEAVRHASVYYDLKIINALLVAYDHVYKKNIKTDFLYEQVKALIMDFFEKHYESDET